MKRLSIRTFLQRNSQQAPHRLSLRPIAEMSGCRCLPAKQTIHLFADPPDDPDRMVIIVDTREHPQAIRKILRDFEAEGVRVIRSKLYVGDYQRIDNGLLVVDRKQNLTEIAGNLTQGHKRFRDELERAKQA